MEGWFVSINNTWAWAQRQEHHHWQKVGNTNLQSEAYVCGTQNGSVVTEASFQKVRFKGEEGKGIPWHLFPCGVQPNQLMFHLCIGNAGNLQREVGKFIGRRQSPFQQKSPRPCCKARNNARVYYWCFEENTGRQLLTLISKPCEGKHEATATLFTTWIYNINLPCRQRVTGATRALLSNGWKPNLTSVCIRRGLGQAWLKWTDKNKSLLAIMFTIDGAWGKTKTYCGRWVMKNGGLD